MIQLLIEKKLFFTSHGYEWIIKNISECGSREKIFKEEEITISNYCLELLFFFSLNDGNASRDFNLTREEDLLWSDNGLKKIFFAF